MIISIRENKYKALDKFLKQYSGLLLEDDMTLKEKLNEDFKIALKQQDALKVSVLRMLKTDITKKEKEKKDTEINDEQIMTIIQKMVKQHHDSIEQFKKGNRQDLVDKETAELKILESYLPEKLSEDEISSEAQNIIKETGASSPKDMGKVMGILMKNLKSTGKTFDGDTVKNIVQKLLLEQKETSESAN